MKNFLCVKRTYTGVGYLCIRIIKYDYGQIGFTL